MSSKTPGEPEDKSYNTLPFLPYRHVHIPSAPGPPGMTTVNLSPAPPDLPIAPLGPVSLVVLRPSEKDNVVPSGMTDMRLQSQSLQGAASNTAPADSPSTVTDSSRRPGAEHSDDDSEASPSHKQVSAKSKKKKRTRTLTTAPQAAALFALLARVSLDYRTFFFRLTHSYRPNFLRRASEKRLDEVLAYLQGRCRSVSAIQYKR